MLCVSRFIPRRFTFCTIDPFLSLNFPLLLPTSAANHVETRREGRQRAQRKTRFDRGARYEWNNLQFYGVHAGQCKRIQLFHAYNVTNERTVRFSPLVVSTNFCFFQKIKRTEKMIQRNGSTWSAWNVSTMQFFNFLYNFPSVEQRAEREREREKKKQITINSVKFDKLLN